MKLESIHSPYRKSGFTLVEVMVSITLSIVLLAGVGQIYSSSKQIYRLQEGQSRVQENGRFAIEFLNRDIRQAGFAGCGNLNNPDFQGQVNVIANTMPPTTFNPASVIQGIETTADWPGGAPTDYVNNTDAVIISLASNGVKLAGNLNPVNANLQITSNALGFKQNDLVFVTDCKNADLFSITNVPGTGPGVATLAHSIGANTGNNLSTPYQQDAEVLRFQTIAYYIRLGPANTAGVRIRSLYKRVGNGAPEELIEGVQDMQVLYGEDTDNDQSANRYITAAAVNMANVVSVRISLLVRSVEDNVLGNQTVAYNGANVAAPNGQLYRVFTTTVALRNRTP
jgi:type IV pilus assembly protein PilW